MKEILIQLALILDLLVHGSVITYERPEPIVTPEPPREVRIATSSAPLTVKLKVEDDQEAWLNRLIQCESGGKASAINPLDKDGTPSYGLLQFKPSTFTGYRRQYGLPEAELMDPEAQKETVRHMMQDQYVDWNQQFPACVRRLGAPPMLN